MAHCLRLCCWTLPWRAAHGIFLQRVLQITGGRFPCQPRCRVLAFSRFNIVDALWLPGTGMLLDRFGSKRVILVSTLVYGLVLCSALWVGAGLWQLYVLFTILGAAMASGPSPVSPGVVISHWFDRHRGLAFGLAMMGIGVGAIVVPIVAERLGAQFDWRIMANCRNAIPDDGVLLLVEWDVLAENVPSNGKFIDIVMLVLTGGRERSTDEYRNLLASAGFRLNKVYPTAAQFAVIEAFPV